MEPQAPQYLEFALREYLADVADAQLGACGVERDKAVADHAFAAAARPAQECAYMRLKFNDFERLGYEVVRSVAQNRGSAQWVSDTAYSHDRGFLIPFAEGNQPFVTAVSREPEVEQNEIDALRREEGVCLFCAERIEGNEPQPLEHVNKQARDMPLVLDYEGEFSGRFVARLRRGGALDGVIPARNGKGLL